jgi:hypothetical protein
MLILAFFLWLMNSEKVLSYQSQFGFWRQLLLYKKNGGKKKLYIS